MERSDGTLPRKGGQRGERTNEALQYGRHIDMGQLIVVACQLVLVVLSRGIKRARWNEDGRGRSGIDTTQYIDTLAPALA